MSLLTNSLKKSQGCLSDQLFWSQNKHEPVIIKLLYNYCCAPDYGTNLLRVKEMIMVGLRDLVNSGRSRMNQIC